MKYTISALAALLMAGHAFAQAPAQAPKPARPATPAVPAHPATAAPAAERAPTADEELALAALEGLMAQSPDRALPILKKVLAGPQSTLVKQRALFVLSQIDGPEAQAILAQTARSSDAAMRSEAIRSIGIGGDPKALDALLPIYNAGSAEVKEEVLQAWMIAGRAEPVYQVALNAKTEEEASMAIHMLGVMGATEELRKLSDRPNAARGLVEAWALSGDLAMLRKIAEGNGDLSVRVDAVQKMGIVDGDAARAALREIYAGSTEPQIKEAALQGMMIADDEQGILTLYRGAKTSEEKRTLLRMLSTMDGDAALQAIDAALDTKSTAPGPATPPATNAVFEKKFQQEAKKYDQKYLREGEVVYCMRGATKSLPPTECITETALRKQVEDYQRNRNAVPRSGTPQAGTVPGG